jgi:LmbE family N-acetylglucosaminyl deacetylase
MRTPTGRVARLCGTLVALGLVLVYVSVVRAAATSLRITGLAATTPAGQAVAFTVTAVDGAGNVASDYRGTVHFSCNFPASVLPANYTFTAADAGVHQFSFTPKEAGLQILDVNDTAIASIAGEATTTCVPVAASQYVISNLTNGSALNAGVPAPFDITAYDPYWNVATSYNGTGIITSSDPAAVLPGPVAFSSGVAHTSITFMTAGAQSVTATDSVNASMTDTAWATITAAPNATITAPNQVTTGQTGITASVPSQSGVTYTWTITNGSITAGAGTRQITFTAGAVGTLTLKCVVKRTSTGVSTTGTKSITVVAVNQPVTPTITAASPVTAGATGRTASVTARTGMTYTWTLSAGTITSAGGASGVTSGTTNTITYTAPTAPGTLTITCVEKNSSGQQSSPGTKSVTVVAAPTTPVITAPSPVTASSTGNTASVTANSGMTYTWTISAGTITSSGGASGVTNGNVNSITYTAPATTGNITITCSETNAAGTPSSPGSATVNVVPPVTTPQTPTITGANPVTANSTGNTAQVTARTGMTYTWTITNGTITSAGGTAGVTSGTTNTITYTAGTVGSIALTCAESNSAGASSSPGSFTVTVVAPPSTPVISAASPVTAGSSGNTASVTANPGMTYSWTINNGSITSAGGASGVTSGGVNSITYTAGVAGTITLTCVERNAAGSASAPGAATVNITGSTGGIGHLYFVAHEDDELLFVNPALEQSIRAGVPTRVVYLTAAGSPDTASWQAREHAVYGSTIAMTGIVVDPYADSATYWTISSKTYAGKTVVLSTLNLNPSVSVLFIRLPDGGLSSLWSTTNGPPFFVNPVASLTTADNANTYTKADLINTLSAIISDFQPGSTGTQDCTFAYGDDHQDHITSALFALEAEHTYWRPHLMRQFRGYNIYGNYFTIPAPEIANLSPAEYNEKTRVMVAYAGGFPAGSDYDHWCARHYAIAKMPGGTGALITPGGLCVQPSGGSSASGTPVVLAPQNDSLAQRWTITSDGLVQGTGGKCLTVGTNGSTVTIEDAVGSIRQRWTYFSNGQLRGYNGMTLTVAADGVTLIADLPVADQSANQWTVPASQLFTLQFGRPGLGSSGTNFSDADVPAATTYGATLALADVNGDGYPDACIRLPGGVYVALNNGGTGFLPYQLYSADFSDANGWQPDAYGSTLQFADVNHDGKVDIIARASNGVVVALANASGTGFLPPVLWSTDFSDAAGYGALASYYRTLRLADVNGDGYPDLCMRGPNGIMVGLNTKQGSFAPATLWSANFSDANGWQADKYGTTIQFGDINGDGIADVCGRSSAGIMCAISSGTGFINYHQWSLRADFSDAAGWGNAAAYYGSLHLADVNGDGLADLCGRGPNGIVVATCHGNGFDRALTVMGRDFTDAAGWAADQYGSSIRFGDLNRDGKADVIGRSANGLIGSLAP